MRATRSVAGIVPMAEIGTGTPLLALPGIWPTTGVAGRALVHSAIAPAQGVAGSRRVLVFNRWHAMAPTTTLRDIAAQYAAALTAIGAAPLDVVGTSTGGSIAQQLAADFPHLVRRLVLISAGGRLRPASRQAQEDVAAQLESGEIAGAWGSIGAEMLPGTWSRVGQVAGRLLGPRLHRASEVSDLAVTLRAEDRFDLADLAPITVPTLIVVGADDTAYESAEAAKLIAGSHLRVIPNKGHTGVLSNTSARAAIVDFLMTF